MTAPATDAPRILRRADHSISRKAIASNALKVLYRLNRAKMLGYLCGGAVRDHLLDLEPKDYDVATEARPPQVKRLFRNSRVIGRRFRLVHVYFHEGIIEVSTFRRGPDPDSQRSAPGELLITDDNVFGTPSEDAFRRDFTVNALFYNIADYSVIDYVGGIDDLEAGRIRAIGDPNVRFQEDPVRMMRACEYAGRLGFTIERRTQEGLIEQRREIEKAAPARLLEELTQLLRSRSSAPTLQWMVELGLLEFVLPDLQALVSSGDERSCHGIFGALDQAVAAGREPSDSALLTALMFPNFHHQLELREGERKRPLKAGARRLMALEHATRFATRFRISKVRAERVADTLVAAKKMAEPGWEMPDRIRFSQRSVFDDAYLLLSLMGDLGRTHERDVAAWHGVAKARRSKPKREQKPAGKPRPRRRRRRKRRT